MLTDSPGCVSIFIIKNTLEESMKKIIIASFLSLIAVIAGGITFMIFTDRLMFQPPALFSHNPKLTYVTGEVKYKTPDSDEWEEAQNGDSLPEGTVISTGKNARADIRFSNDMALRLSSNSKLVLSTATIRRKIIRLDEGSVYGHFKREFQDQSIKVVTPTAVASVRGTELGFELIETTEAELLKSDEESDDAEKKGTSGKGEKDKPEKIPATAIYAISGIVDVENASVKDSNMLLSFQTQTLIGGDKPPADPVKITDGKNKELRTVLNSIHFDEVIFISEKIHFDVGSATIKAESYKELNKIAEILNSRSEKIRIEGHTDSQGPAQYNYVLSTKRADAIREYLISQDVNPKRISVKGYGESRPIVDNTSPLLRAKNRRVEFVVEE